MHPVGDRTTSDLCRGFTCATPVTAPRDIGEQLDRLRGRGGAETASMDIPVDIWLRGTNHATSGVIAPVGRAPSAWTETDVEAVLVEMLRALDRAADPQADAARPVRMRGFSWIVNPFDDGVVIALELSLGAVVAGPLDIAERELTAMIGRVVAADRARDPSTSATVH